ncbi:hypothetical protein DN069_12715 [Streptacidiphilus pinicola]|uniref:Uncharacterized protein n=1 Tax=Streptacidiphilus pinicola TaxID=2219663 RepID=A0A2X0K7H6_9ACTN|nr:hypothetical protein DN069_12715 [Streptacidiphilus pinicola]
MLAAGLLAMGGVAGCSSDPKPSAKPAPALRLDAAQASALAVVDDYERSGAAVKTGQPKKADPAGLTAYVANAQVAARMQGGGGVGAPVGCGAASGRTVVDGALVGTPVAHGSAGGMAVPVSLYVGTRAAARLTLDTDAAGRVTDFSCATAADPDLPGGATVVGYYGGAAAAFGAADADAALGRLRQQYLDPGFASFTRPGLDGDQSTCAEDGSIPYWHAVYAPGRTGTGAQWYFWPGGSGQVIMSVAVDRSAPRVSWVYCVGQLQPQLAPAAYSDDQVQSYVGGVLDSYAYLQALKPYGADTSAIAGYFTSPAAYRDALAGTGAQPLECASKAASSMTADAVSVTGTTAVVTLTANPTAHELTPGETALGHPKVTLDLKSMKIVSVSCA